jgi:hypothetical protein
VRHPVRTGLDPLRPGWNGTNGLVEPVVASHIIGGEGELMISADIHPPAPNIHPWTPNIHSPTPYPTPDCYVEIQTDPVSTNHTSPVQKVGNTPACNTKRVTLQVSHSKCHTASGTQQVCRYELLDDLLASFWRAGASAVPGILINSASATCRVGHVSRRPWVASAMGRTNNSALPTHRSNYCTVTYGCQGCATSIPFYWR